jgi:hypothetical protein
LLHLHPLQSCTTSSSPLFVYLVAATLLFLG